MRLLWIYLLSTEFCALLIAALSAPMLGMVSDDVSEDSKIIREILDGNPNAYRSLVERYQGRIYNVIFKMVRDREEAEEFNAAGSICQSLSKSSEF